MGALEEIREHFYCGESGCQEKMFAFWFLFPGKQNTLAALGGQGKSRYDSILQTEEYKNNVFCSSHVSIQWDPSFQIALRIMVMTEG